MFKHGQKDSKEIAQNNKYMIVMIKRSQKAEKVAIDDVHESEEQGREWEFPKQEWERQHPEAQESPRKENLFLKAVEELRKEGRRVTSMEVMRMSREIICRESKVVTLDNAKILDDIAYRLCSPQSHYSEIYVVFSCCSCAISTEIFEQNFFGSRDVVRT